MKDDIELVRGSGNVFRDFGRPNADFEQMRAIVAAKIIRTIDAIKVARKGNLAKVGSPDKRLKSLNSED